MVGLPNLAQIASSEILEKISPATKVPHEGSVEEHGRVEAEGIEEHPKLWLHAGQNVVPVMLLTQHWQC